MLRRLACVRRLCTAPRPLLEGVTVLELASVLAGPSTTQFLAELGASVVKVENTTTGGDVTRTWRLGSADPAGEDVTAYFSSCNLGKRSVALNLRDPRGLDAVHRLAASSEPVVCARCQSCAHRRAAQSSSCQLSASEKPRGTAAAAPAGGKKEEEEAEEEEEGAGGGASVR